ncbi:MAG: dephospho-CoA kinase [Alphaproteobacteria bacterium]|jgi:dephospho-CoA kinase
MDKSLASIENLASTKYIVGVTGGIGCGKTTVTDLFAAKGIDIVDADVVARDVVVAGSQGLKALVLVFGDRILSAQNTLNRSALREIIFADSKAKEKVNGLLHPLIRQNMMNQLQNTRSHYCILSAPLLFENNLQQIVNRTLVVDIAESQQLERTLGRDGGNESTIKNIMAAQVSREKRLSLATDTIDNSKALHLLAPQVDSLHSKYIKLATQKLAKN